MDLVKGNNINSRIYKVAISHVLQIHILVANVSKNNLSSLLSFLINYLVWSGLCNLMFTMWWGKIMFFTGQLENRQFSLKRPIFSMPVSAGWVYGTFIASEGERARQSL